MLDWGGTRVAGEAGLGENRNGANDWASRETRVARRDDGNTIGFG